jgi:hypothetical protein
MKQLYCIFSTSGPWSSDELCYVGTLRSTPETVVSDLSITYGAGFASGVEVVGYDEIARYLDAQNITAKYEGAELALIAGPVNDELVVYVAVEARGEGPSVPVFPLRFTVSGSGSQDGIYAFPSGLAERPYINNDFLASSVDIAEHLDFWALQHEGDGIIASDIDVLDLGGIDGTGRAFEPEWDHRLHALLYRAGIADLTVENDQDQTVDRSNVVVVLVSRGLGPSHNVLIGGLPDRAPVCVGRFVRADHAMMVANTLATKMGAAGVRLQQG